MWRLLGCVLVLIGTGVGGFVVARSYSQRPGVLRALRGALTMLTTEITYGTTPLPEAASRIARHSPAPVDTFFRIVSASLRDDAVCTATAWREAVARQRGRWPLTSADENVLFELAAYIGQSFAADQEKHLQLALSRLDRQQEEAREQADVQTRLWRYLGICTGLLVVLLLY